LTRGKPWKWIEKHFMGILWNKAAGQEVEDVLEEEQGSEEAEGIEERDKCCRTLLCINHIFITVTPKELKRDGSQG
jgi:hypothetical protein